MWGLEKVPPRQRAVLSLALLVARTAPRIPSSQCMPRGPEAGEPDPGDVTSPVSEGALLQAFLERELALFQQMLHRTLVLCFAFTDGLLLKRGEGATCKSYSDSSLCTCFLKLRSHLFSLVLGYFREL